MRHLYHVHLQIDYKRNSRMKNPDSSTFQKVSRTTQGNLNDFMFQATQGRQKARTRQPKATVSVFWPSVGFKKWSHVFSVKLLESRSASSTPLAPPKHAYSVSNSSPLWPLFFVFLVSVSFVPQEIISNGNSSSGEQSCKFLKLISRIARVFSSDADVNFCHGKNRFPLHVQQ